MNTATQKLRVAEGDEIVIPSAPSNKVLLDVLVALSHSPDFALFVEKIVGAEENRHYKILFDSADKDALMRAQGGLKTIKTIFDLQRHIVPLAQKIDLNK